MFRSPDRKESSDLTNIIQRGVSGKTSYTTNTRSADFGNVLVVGGDSSHRLAALIFYSAGGCTITPILSPLPYTLSATFDAGNRTLTMTSATIMYGGVAFIE